MDAGGRPGASGGGGVDPSADDRKRRRSPEDDAAAAAEAEADARRGVEQARLDAEMDKRRQKVEAWRAARRAEEQAKEKAAADDAAAAEDAAAAQRGRKAWTLDGEDDEEDEADGAGAAERPAGEPASGGLRGAADGPGPASGPPLRRPGAAAAAEVDPLDAFMAASAGPAAASAAAAPSAKPPVAGPSGRPVAVPGAGAPLVLPRTMPRIVVSGPKMPGVPKVIIKPPAPRPGAFGGPGPALAMPRPQLAAPRPQLAALRPQAAAAAALAMDSDDVDPLDAFMARQVAPEAERLMMEAAARASREEQADEVDPLDAFMAGVAGAGVGAGEVGDSSVGIDRPGSRVGGTAGPAPASAPARRNMQKRRGGRGAGSDESSSDEAGSADEDGGGSDDDAAWAKRASARAGSKADKIPAVDHSTIDYPPFRKNFYIEAAEIKRMSEEDVAELRRTLDGIKVRGRDVPRPVKSWAQCGLSNRVQEVIRKAAYPAPMPIQAQALPVIMSGRDCIGIAKTGSGKTLAFVLPMLRHIKDQPDLVSGDGPIALVMAPTRELVAQIAKEVKRFTKMIDLTCVCVYGGSGVATQIGELKRGAEVVVCTPGRMIDILATGAGRVTNFRRVTYLVLDEADRMFDMGFEPQIMKIVNLIRPTRQTVMFSATFPRQVEALAKSALQSPVEIQIGGRSVVNADITQLIELRPEADRFLRLLELLGEWYERGKVIVFVHSQDKCDTLFRDLLRVGYPCLSLHGGKEQSDRECTISDFKGTVCNVLIATSVAARGLDVKDLQLVVNYDVPSHHEDYVHRVGRTGRAGQKGTAVTFIAEEEEQFAPDLVKALRESSQPVPDDLLKMADSFAAKRREGKSAAHGSGFGGTGFKFDRAEADRPKEARTAALKELGLGEEEGAEGEPTESGVFGEEGSGAVRQVGGPAPAPPAVGPPAPARGLDMAAAAAAANKVLAARATAPTALLTPAPVAPPPPGGALAGALPRPLSLPPPAPLGAPLSPLPAPPLAITPPPVASDGTPTPPPVPEAPGAGAMVVVGGLAPSPPPAAPPPGGLAPGSAAALAAARAAQLAATFSVPPVGGVYGASPMTLPRPPGQTEAQAKAAAFAAQLNLQVTLQRLQQQQAERAAAVAAAVPVGGHRHHMHTAAPHFSAELEINDLPQTARWKVTHKDSLGQVSEFTGAAITTKGVYTPPGKQPPPGERKIYLLIEGPTESSVKSAKAEIKKMVDAIGAGGGGGGGGGQAPGKYSLM